MSTDRLSTLAGEISREIPRTHTADPDIQPWDSWLLATVLALVGFGLVMLYSASAVMSARSSATRSSWSSVRPKRSASAFSGSMWRFAWTIAGTSAWYIRSRSEEHTSELQSRPHLVCRLLLEKKKKNKK